ncbi:SpoIIE family protein phosphatase [Anaerosacchariphilus sp. NSJ-68]|uniref:SpoIIE family protein phosphatase n=2 Tax=Lachnospiraceae TaxID=186803 RepID=A0A923RLS4_9FIRM|nr:SpoIIE family protein phosphatase [Anaerosacchariphilus hominis]MBC5698145.1 SpoIIE family protein phosphatase [Roseburia difficilis]
MKKEMEQHGGEGYGWLYGLVAGFSVAAMQIGMGLLQMERDYAVLLGAAQGILVCSLTVICGGILAWLLRPLPQEEQDRPPFPAMNRVQEYRSAFRNLARSFSGGEVGQEQTEELDGAARMNLLWNTRLQENRAAVALQLNEMADIMTDTVEHAWETQTDGELEDFLEKRLRGMGLKVYSVLVYREEHRRQEVYLTVSTRKKRCVSVKEIAAVLSKLMKKAMMPGRDSRAFVGSEKITVLFVERTNFQVLCGVEKAVKGKEEISGDNFSLHHCREGRFIGALSDGMGSGMAAYRDSEMVIDLLEQFLEAGFSKETAVRMINSALIVRSDAQVFSTIDISSLDLYTGVCEFLKVGASTTFIRRENWVEVISSTSLPAGVFHKLEPDCSGKKLYDGDMVIMVTDGVMDALPAAHQEKMMKDIILEHDTGNPSELAAYILNRVRQYSGKEPADDMTVLVMGLVKY